MARLGGRLPSHYLRQVAHAIVDRVEGVRTVLDQIEVNPRSGRSATLLVAVEAKRADPHRESRMTRA